MVAASMIAGTWSLLLRRLLAASDALIDSPGSTIEIGSLEVKMIAASGSSSIIAPLYVGPILISGTDLIPRLRLLLHEISRIDLSETAA
mgnify:CR=1 FL=1